MNVNIEYDTKICPYCGNKCKFPETGEITKNEAALNKFLDDDKYCIIGESVDEGGRTIGYHIICRNRT